MSDKKTNHKERIFGETRLSIDGLCSESKILNWVLFGAGKIQLSSRSDEFDVNVLAVPLNNGVLDKESSKEILVPLGAIGLISPRTTIINGSLSKKLYRGAEKVSNSDFDLTILNPEKALIKLGREIAGDKIYNSLATLKSAPYVELDALYDGKRIKCYVSCYEVFRFYYGSSNGLLNSCLRDGTAEELIFNPNVPDKIGSVHFVQLRKNLYDVDAPSAARIRFDKYAKTQFENIKSYTKFNVINNPERWITCKPPTNQKKINWSVSGRFLRNKAILITNIYGCSSSPPFSELIFGRDNDSRTDNMPRKIRYVEKLRPRKKDDDTGMDNEKKEDDKDSKSIGGPESIDSPNVDFETEIIDYSDQAGQFIGFSDVKVQKIEKAELKTDERVITIIKEVDLEELPKLATSKPHGRSSNVQKASVVATKNKGAKPKDLHDYEVSIYPISKALLRLQFEDGVEYKTYILKESAIKGNEIFFNFPHEVPLNKKNKKPNEFGLVNINILKIHVNQDKEFSFAFVEFYNIAELLEKRSCLMIDITEYDEDKLPILLKLELNSFRENGRTWGHIVHEYDDGSKESEKIKGKHKFNHSTERNSSNEVRLKVFKQITECRNECKEILNNLIKKYSSNSE